MNETCIRLVPGAHPYYEECDSIECTQAKFDEAIRKLSCEELHEFIEVLKNAPTRTE